MEITYIGHSGFLMQWEACYWLFDYYKGEIPELAADKKLFVFVSHKHGDHFNPEIFRLYDKCPDVEFVLSSDIKPQKINFQKQQITAKIADRIISVEPSMEYELKDNNHGRIKLRTLKSTDCGVAFLLQYQGKKVYHAGDLNLWVWREETKQYNNNMTAKFNIEMEYLKDMPIDIAFVPLDPRLEECYSMGLDALLDTAKVRYVFPMHFWNKPSVIQQYRKERVNRAKDTVIMDIGLEGQKWKIS